MFEAAFLPHTETGEVLRPLEWAEIVARFAAVRDVRELIERPSCAAGSFVAGALSFSERHGKRTVNFHDLGRGKSPDEIGVDTAGEAGVGDQGTQ